MSDRRNLRLIERSKWFPIDARPKNGDFFRKQPQLERILPATFDRFDFSNRVTLTFPSHFIGTLTEPKERPILLGLRGIDEHDRDRFASSLGDNSAPTGRLRLLLGKDDGSSGIQPSPGQCQSSIPLPQRHNHAPAETSGLITNRQIHQRDTRTFRGLTAVASRLSQRGFRLEFETASHFLKMSVGHVESLITPFAGSR